MYKKIVKRVLDFILSLIAVSLLSPLFLVLIVIGAIAMKGNPFLFRKGQGVTKIFLD